MQFRLTMQRNVRYKIKLFPTVHRLYRMIHCRNLFEIILTYVALQYQVLYND